MASVTDFQIRVLRRLLFAGRRRSRRYILRGGGAHKSRTLAREMQVFIQNPERGFLYVDPYWAVYFHDGRNSITGKNLVWFRNPRLDPRLRGGRSPNRARDLRRLTRSQFREAQRQGLLVIRKRVRGVSPTPFFSNSHGMQGFLEEATVIVRDEFRKFVTEELGDDLKLQGNIQVPIRAGR